MAVWEPAANGHTGSITALAVSPDSKWVASGSDDTMIILWDTEDQSVVRKWESHGDVVWHLAFSPDNLKVDVGETVTFRFMAKNHTVTQSSFANPCTPLGESSANGLAGFDSGL